MSKGSLLHVDLCCGLGGWMEPFKDDDKWFSVGFDISPDLNADVIADIRRLPLRDDTDVTLLTMSPPCIEFTKWKLPWFGDGACEGNPSMELVEACLQAIEQINPDYWILENVVGLHMFWTEARKHVGPFYFWGEFPPFDAETVYKDQRLQPADRRSELSAKIPSHISRSLKRSVEMYV